MQLEKLIPVECLNQETFSPYGWVLPQGAHKSGFSQAGSDFWHVHDFNPGAAGESEILWVTYRNTSLVILSLEAHWLTEQAIVPLGAGEIVQVVCTSRNDPTRLPDLDRLRAFKIGAGRGVCMRPGIWHASFSSGGEVACIMLTRRSTTRDLVDHLEGKSVAVETSIVELESIDGRLLKCVTMQGTS